jgi:mycofactocin precursor
MDGEIGRLDPEVKDMCAESSEQPAVLEEITLEEMAVDGICGIY